MSDAREIHSSGATHVPSQPSTIPSPRTLPRCDSGLPRDTLNGKGIETLILQKQQGERNAKKERKKESGKEIR